MNAHRPLSPDAMPAPRPHAARALVVLAVALLAAAGPATAIEPAVPGAAPRNAAVQAAELAVSAGDCRRASEGYAKAVADLRDPRIARRAVEVAVGCSHLPAAWQSAQRWLALDGENVDALRAAGLIALELHRIDDARRIFADLLSKPDVEADRALGDLLPLVTAGDHAQAGWMTFGSIVDRNAIDDASRLALADLAIEADNYAGARSLVESVIARDADNAAAHRTLGLLLAADDQTEPAIAAARRAATLDTENQSFAVAEVLAALDRQEEAHVELLRLLDNEALRDDAERRLAMLAMQSGDFDEARQRFGARLQRGVASAESFFYLALLAERRGDKDLALQSYERLVAAGGGLLPRMRAASLLIEAGRRADALKLLDDVPVSSRDDIIDLPIARSNLLQDAGAAKEALAVIDAALQKHPEHPQLLYQRAMLLERGGRTRDAVKVFERLLAARPRDASVQNALGYTLGDRNMQLERADKLVQQALAEVPDNAAVLDSVAWLRFRRGDARGALPLLERAYRLSRDAEIAAHWAEALWVTGDKAGARMIWARALARDPDSAPLRESFTRLTGQKIGADAKP